MSIRRQTYKAAERIHTMATLVINIILGSWVLLFAAMAILPMLLDRSKSSPRRTATPEDRVVRLEHRAVIERRRGAPQPLLAPLDSIGDHPSHRPAA
jgi:hypothetical protein